MFREYCRPIGEANQTNLGTVSKPISPQFYRVKARKDVIRPLATGGLPMLFAGHRLNLRIEFAAGARLDEPRGVGPTCVGGLQEICPSSASMGYWMILPPTCVGGV